MQGAMCCCGFRWEAPWGRGDERANRGVDKSYALPLMRDTATAWGAACWQLRQICVAPSGVLQLPCFACLHPATRLHPPHSSARCQANILSHFVATVTLDPTPTLPLPGQHCGAQQAQQRRGADVQGAPAGERDVHRRQGVQDVGVSVGGHLLWHVGLGLVGVSMGWRRAGWSCPGGGGGGGSTFNLASQSSCSTASPLPPFPTNRWRLWSLACSGRTCPPASAQSRRRTRWGA